MKTLKKEFEEITNNTLDEYGVLMAGDMPQELAQRLYNAMRARKEKHMTCPRNWLMALHTLCGKSVTTVTVGMRKQLAECGVALIAENVSIDDLPKFGDWFRDFTRGWPNRPDFPTPSQVRNYWGQFEASRRKSPPARRVDAAEAQHDIAARVRL